ncbi:hypothetical protein [Natronococcus amylolyticus]|uniref:hypothetical protein n=1 Tax=Natronococcus amylolyticus TaxID=44470 RepID=UPI001268F917|nr:hypothetical protein [Natronococcus amylolyticus]
MAFVGITLLFLLFLKMKTENSYWMFLFLLVLLFVTLSHQVSILQFLFLFGVLLACSHIVGERLIIKPMHLVILSVAPALHWIFFSLDFVEVTILNRIVGGVSTEAQVTDTAGQSLHHAIYYVNTYIIILLSVVGIYVIYTTSDKKWLRAIALFGLVTAPIYLPSPITSIPQADIFRFDRFILILSPFVSYLMARGLIGSLSIMSLKKRWGPIKRMVVVLVIVLFLLSSILIPVNTPNGADIEEASWTGPPVHFSNSEQQGLEQIDQKLVSNENIYSDHYSIRYLERNTLEPENEYETLDINNSSHRSNSVVVLREDSLRTDGIMIEDNATRGEYNDISLIEHHQSSNKIYSNEALVGYNW